MNMLIKVTLSSYLRATHFEILRKGTGYLIGRNISGTVHWSFECKLGLTEVSFILLPKAAWH